MLTHPQGLLLSHAFDIHQNIIIISGTLCRHLVYMSLAEPKLISKFEFFPSYRPKRDLSKSLWRDSGSDDLNEDGCTGEKEYCEIVDACVDDCDLFQTKDDSTPFVIVCKEGLVSLK